MKKINIFLFKMLTKNQQMQNYKRKKWTLKN